ncbi:LysM domain/BON superfamily protein [Roseovarius gaetbuli]|uniref:LysM domain/BON superfamily protein n=1 Tax=Roseovarius gaetbuli TaxID=1356575 RepID=A0A1X6ZAY0_9RHOB|nr:LysM peptidoglycan-binding domain-containing protein [Roseovarius gaetbuli]SLN45882.1 LysM domain/BON superfamily protein [Roseovarius gaetbuli]
MSKFAGLGTGPALGAAGAVVIGFAGLAMYFGGLFDPETPPGPEKTVMVEPQPVLQDPDTAETPSAPVTAEVTPAPAMPDPPSVDTFRLDPDGQMLVAGQGTPGWMISILLDGIAIASVAPDNAGKFVQFLDLPTSDQPRILSLSMASGDGGQTLASVDEIIIAPTPRVVAAAPKPEPAVEAAQSEPVPTPDATEAEGTQTAEAKPEPTEPAKPVVEMAEGAAETVSAAAVSALPAVSQTVLLADEAGVRVLQAPTSDTDAPEVMSSVALDAITYSDDGEVELSGRAEGSGFVRIYLDNTPVTTSPVAADGNWNSELPEVDTGVYTLRVDEVSPEGAVVSRVETPFKREDQAVLLAQDDANPSARVRAVTVQPGSTLWAISREAYGDGVMYVRVFEANRDRIRDPDLIYPGQVFALPQ